MKTRTLAFLAAAMAAGLAAAQAPAQGLVGKPAPEIAAQDWLNSPPLSLQAAKGKIVVVEFWATWCPPCRASIPHLIEMFKAYSPKGVVFMGLTDEPKATVEPFAKEMKMIYPVGCGSQSAGAYGVRGIPHAFIIDPSGNVAWEGHPMAGLDKALEAQLAKTPPATPATRAALEQGRPERMSVGRMFVTGFESVVDATPIFVLLLLLAVMLAAVLAVELVVYLVARHRRKAIRADPNVMNK